MPENVRVLAAGVEPIDTVAAAMTRKKRKAGTVSRTTPAGVPERMVRVGKVRVVPVETAGVGLPVCFVGIK